MLPQEWKLDLCSFPRPKTSCENLIMKRAKPLKESLDWNLSKTTTVRGRNSLQDQKVRFYPDDDGVVEIRLASDDEHIHSLCQYRFLVVEMRVEMDAMAVVELQFSQNMDENPSNTLTYQLIPSHTVILPVRFQDLQSDKLFLKTMPGMLKAKCKGLPSSIEKMRQVSLVVSSPYCTHFQWVEIEKCYLSNDLPPITIAGAPMVDEFGQWIQKEWNGKIHSETELVSFLQTEYKAAVEQETYPEGFSQYGGFLKVRFDKTGFFHLRKTKERWWLVDPDGYGFFSNGICYGSRMGVYGFVDGMERLFTWLPEETNNTFSEAWTSAESIPEYVKRNGIEAGRNRRMFNFARANMIRAFGEKHWWEAWHTINVARIKKWGFNTIGIGVNQYADEKVLKYLDRARIPFVWTLKNFPLTKERVFRDFPDVYAPEYRENARIFAEEQLKPFVGNPYLIGYFITNEPEWRFQNVNLAERTFAHPKLLESKKHLIQTLKEKYGCIKALNRAWKSSFREFADLQKPTDNLDGLSEGSMKDMGELHDILLHQYERVVHEELRKVDQDHLDLGMRYAYGGVSVMGGCKEHDVFSFNCYSISPEKQLETCRNVADVPMMIGEWHIGGANQGKLSGGLLFSPDQEERGKALEYFLQRALAHPNCVGAHYFEWNDQPLLGRFDGECMGHGLIDVCNRPYEKTIAHIRNTNLAMYDYIAGIKRPTTSVPKIIDAIHKIRTF